MNPVLPQDNTFDLTIITKQLKLNAELLMQEMTAHASKLMSGPASWVKVQERLPPNDCSVLMAIYDARPKVEMFFIEIGARMNEDWYFGSDGTHVNEKGRKVMFWMPLPDKPKKEDI